MLGKPRPPRRPAGHDREVDIERRKPPAENDGAGPAADGERPLWVRLAGPRRSQW
jgi:hypothetical protein